MAGSGMSIQCRCGRFLADAHPVVKVHVNSYDAGEYVADVRGNCSRCGDDVPATPGWWHSWDAWEWEDA
jgi:hypothetical protein